MLDEVALKERARALGALLRASAEGLVGDEFAAVLLLDGPMGAGKTTFTRALAAGLGVAHAERVCSPTFTLCMVHAGAGPGPVTLIHVDLFRLADADDEGMGGVAGFDALDLEEIAGEAMSIGAQGRRRGAAGARRRVGGEVVGAAARPPCDPTGVPRGRGRVRRFAANRGRGGPRGPFCGDPGPLVGPASDDASPLIKDAGAPPRDRRRGWLGRGSSTVAIPCDADRRRSSSSLRGRKIRGG
ncbi:MAG: tRNA (adenosine(37)-N6)-threonylcarbamoyltransferase complex ATPase subunit type 1 TsaE [Nannocystis sp.]|nr:tRNA (adenosine(37)-N6)-threonylcarbamoyltransferase complex ATPase subunit type 1 TsaE [Nannocystis sp.]